MANKELTGSSIFLGESSYNGAGAVGSTLYFNNAQTSTITMMTDPSKTRGYVYSGWQNTSTDRQYREGYAGDGTNLDLGEAVRMDINGDGSLNDNWLRVSDFDRYEVEFRMDDGSTVSGVGVIISAYDPSAPRPQPTYQSMVFGDRLVQRLNDTNLNLNRITLTKYIPTGNNGGDLTQRFLTDNFSNDLAEFVVVPCFARGTAIATDQGETAIEELEVGDLVRSVDHGLQQIRWIGARRVPATGNLAPIVFAQGAIGNDRELVVSPQHRMLVKGAAARAMFDTEEVLVPAKALVNDNTIRRREGGHVEYFHILLDEHEVIFANGALAESLYLGPQALKGLSHQGRSEILALFPELEAAIDQGIRPPGARPFLTVRQGRDLAAAAPELV